MGRLVARSQDWKANCVLVLVCVSALSLRAAQPGTLLWKIPLGAPIYSSAAIGDDGAIYIDTENPPTTSSYPERLYSISPNGTTNWAVPAGASGSFFYTANSPAVGPDGHIYYGTNAFTAAGAIAAAINLGNAPPAIETNGVLYVGAYSPTILSLNPDGRTNWTYQTFNNQPAFPTIGPDGTIYVGSYHASIYALLPNGTNRWLDFNGSLWWFSPSIGPYGEVYGASRNSLLCLNPATGETNWTFFAKQDIYTAASVGLDGTLYFGGADGMLYAVHTNFNYNADDQFLRYRRWTFAAGGPVYSTPAIATDGAIYFGCDDGKLYALNPDGTLRWSFTAGSPIRSSPAIGTDGTVYFGTWSGDFYAVKGSAPLANSVWPMYRRDLKHTARASPAATSAPSLSVEGSKGGAPVLSIQAERGRSYSLLATSNLVQWAAEQHFVANDTNVALTLPRTGASTGLRAFRLSSP